MERKVFKSKVDWWVIAIVLMSYSMTATIAIGGHRLFAVLYVIGISVMYSVMFLGLYYAVKGDKLYVYQSFRPMVLPVSKIVEIRFCRNILAGPCLSADRLSIKFSDRSVLKSYMPLEISPKDKDGFIRTLVDINPDIRVVRQGY